MNYSVLLAALVGYTVGNLPDHSTTWLAVKVAFTLALLIFMVRYARQHWKEAR